MEIKIENKQYVFKEELTVDEFMEIGLPPTELMQGFDISKINSKSFIGIIQYQKSLMEVLCIQPQDAKENNVFGMLSISDLNKMASDPNFVKLMFTVMGGGEKGEEPKHQDATNMT